MDITQLFRNPDAITSELQREQLLSGDVHEEINIPFITRAIVKEIDLIGGNLNNENPPNSIRARIFNIQAEKDIILYPFFQSHFSLPIKLEEEVWAFCENISSLQTGYWLTRVIGTNKSEDLNYISWKDAKKGFIKQRTSQKVNNEDTDDADIREETYTGKRDEDSSIAAQLSDETETRQSDTDVFTHKESTPRIMKRANDFILQGSNNTTIILGTDRQNTIDKEASKNEAGTIDIVVGRGQSERTKINKKSNGKRDRNNRNALEGEIDFDTDKSRIYISMNTNPDKLFNTSVQGSLDETNISAIIAKTDAIRIIARSSVKIETQTENKASIILHPDGRIIINGDKVLLGADDAKQQLVLGNKLVDALNQFLDTLNSGNLGNLGAPIPGITASVQVLKNLLNTILSETSLTV